LQHRRLKPSYKHSPCVQQRSRYCCPCSSSFRTHEGYHVWRSTMIYKLFRQTCFHVLRILPFLRLRCTCIWYIVVFTNFSDKLVSICYASYLLKASVHLYMVYSCLYKLLRQTCFHMLRILPFLRLQCTCIWYIVVFKYYLFFACTSLS